MGERQVYPTVTTQQRSSRGEGRDVSYSLMIPVWGTWGGRQQKYLQVVLEKESKSLGVGEVKQRKGRAWPLCSRDSGPHPGSKGL